MLKSILLPIVLGNARCEILFSSMLEKMNAMKKYLQSLFVLHVHSCTHWLRPRNPPPPAFGIIPERYWSAKIDDISFWPPRVDWMIYRGPSFLWRPRPFPPIDDYQTQLLQAKFFSSVAEHSTALYSVLKLYFVVDVPVGEELEPLVLSGGDPLVLQHPHHGGGGAPLAARTPHPPEPVLHSLKPELDRGLCVRCFHSKPTPSV